MQFMEDFQLRPDTEGNSLIPDTTAVKPLKQLPIAIKSLGVLAQVSKTHA